MSPCRRGEECIIPRRRGGSSSARMCNLVSLVAGGSVAGAAIGQNGLRVRAGARCLLPWFRLLAVRVGVRDFRRSCRIHSSQRVRRSGLRRASRRAAMAGRDVVRLCWRRAPVAAGARREPQASCPFVRKSPSTSMSSSVVLGHPSRDWLSSASVESVSDRREWECGRRCRRARATSRVGVGEVEVLASVVPAAWASG